MFYTYDELKAKGYTEKKAKKIIKSLNNSIECMGKVYCSIYIRLGEEMKEELSNKSEEEKLYILRHQAIGNFMTVSIDLVKEYLKRNELEDRILIKPESEWI